MTSRPRLRIRHEWELQETIDEIGQPPELVERDFALMTIVAQLVRDYGDRLCFKGGFVLRHAHGHQRFSKDLDATRINPPKHKLNADAVADSMRRAGMRNLLEIQPGPVEIDTGRSLGFDSVAYSGPLGKGTVALEVSYRETVIKPSVPTEVGPPFYDPFVIPVMNINEIVAEKMRALAQRRRPTDLSDLAMVLTANPLGLNDPTIRELAVKKFELVKPGDRVARIEANVVAMGASYDAAVSALTSDAPVYQEASEIVMRRLRNLIP